MNRSESDLRYAGKQDDSVDSLLKRFKRQVMNEGTLDLVRRRQYFKNKAEKRAEKAKLAKIRAIKARKKKY